ICRALGFDEDSDQFTTVRQVVRGWRERHYFPNLPPDEQNAGADRKRTQTRFLMDFDLVWRIRRLRFLMSKIDDLACFDARGEDTFEAAVEAGRRDGFSYQTNPPENFAEAPRDTLLTIKAAVSQAYRTLRRNRQALWTSPIGALPIQDEQLKEQI